MSGANEWEIVFFTLRVAIGSTLVVLAPGTLVAWLLARHDWRGKSVIETLVALPLVMPPVATGLILLKLVPHGVVFTWRAVVIAMMVMSSPFIVRAARVAFENVS